MPTVIDALIVTLGLDASGVSKGRKQAAAEILNLQEQAKRSGKEIGEAGKGAAEFFEKLRGQVILALAAFTGGRSIKEFATYLSEGSEAVGTMSTLLGTSTEVLSQWRNMARLSGGSADSVANSMSQLNENIQQFSLTGQSSMLPYLNALGLSLVNAQGHIKNVSELLPELHERMKNMDPQQARQYGHGLGLSDDMISILIKGDEEYKKLIADSLKFGTVTKEQAKAAEEYNRSLRSIALIWEDIGRQLEVAIQPALTAFNEGLKRVAVWFQTHPEQMKRAFEGVAVILGVISAYLTGAGIMGALSTIGSVIGVAAGAMVGWIALIVAAGAALFLLWDDWKTWMSGGQSQFGEFYQDILDKWNGIKSWVMPIIDSLKKLWSDFVQANIDEFKLFVALFTGSADDIRDAWGKLTDDIRRMWTDIWDNLGSALEKAAPHIWSAVKHVIGGVFGWMEERINTIWQAMTGHKLFGDRPADQDQQTTATGSSGKINAASREKYQKMIDYLVSQGVRKEEAAGLVANVAHESSGDEKNWHLDTDGKMHGGLLQWSPKRIDNYQKWAQQQGRPSFGQSGWKDQLDFARYEYTQGDERAFGLWMAAHPNANANLIATQMSNLDIQPGDKNGVNYQEGAMRGITAGALMQPYTSDKSYYKDFTSPLFSGAGAAATAQQPPVLNISNTATVGTVNVTAPAGTTDPQAWGKKVGDSLNENLMLFSSNGSYQG